MRSRLVLYLLLTSSALSANAGAISDAFAAGVRGVPWSPGCAPDKVIPGGKWEKAGIVRRYRVSDGKSMLEVSRSRNDYLDFACTSDEFSLSGITISFPGDGDTFAKLVQSLSESFGPFVPPGADGAVTEAGFMTIGSFRWPVDGGFDLRLIRSTVGFSSKTVVSVARRVPIERSRSDRGLE
ncbi:MAG: hypothetical protein H7A18_05720 [Sinobacteraceae bacterium]|nr:hypothetical protein [Nevskiaceae bacterium]MCP5466160.1 hypothetical protein [Nevskiaceae bacterium]MCP5471562.1 hypothetical protein [Nevskiaceae bacterium]